SAYDVTLSWGDLATLDGSVDLTLDAGSISGIADYAGNALSSAAATGSVESYIVDNTAPDLVSIARHSPVDEQTNADTLVFRVRFSEPVHGVDATRFAVSGTTATVTGVASVVGTGVDPN